MREFELITMGRTILDVYGDQVGCGLEDTSSFSKYVGGCPANIAIGTARLGLRVAHIARVGDDHHGRFLKSQLAKEGIDVSHVRTDLTRLTGVAFLGIRDRDTFPLLHYRDDCADMAVAAEDYTRDFIAGARALLVTGSHLTTEKAASNIMHAAGLAKAAGTQVIFDIDYRPVFWRLVAKDAGESRYVSSDVASGITQQVLPFADLIVGTEEEIRIAGGASNTRTALVRIRELSAAPIVLKRGPEGCVVFPGHIPEDLGQGVAGPGFSVEVFNVVGAGDGFLSGFLSGWLRDQAWEECCRRGNACGALVVSRHGCSPASPTAAELDWYLANAAHETKLHDNRTLERVHRATTRQSRGMPAFLLDCSSSAPDARFAETGAYSNARFAALAAKAVQRSAAQGTHVGLLLDGSGCEDALFMLDSATEWAVRAIDIPRVRPLNFLGNKTAGVILRNWPQNQIVKCTVPIRDAGSIELRNERLRELQYAVEMWGHELLLVADENASAAQVRKVVRELNNHGIEPDWWGLSSSFSAAEVNDLKLAIAAENPRCRGILLTQVGGQGHHSDADSGIAAVRSIGPSIVAKSLEEWRSGTLSDEDLLQAIEVAMAAWISSQGGGA